MGDGWCLLIGHDDGLTGLFSDDGGRTWKDPQTLIPQVQAEAIAEGPDGTIYVGTRGAGLFRSRDGLRESQRVEVPSGLEKIRSLWIGRDRFLVGTEAGARPAAVCEWVDGREWKPIGDVMTCPGAGQWFYPVAEEGVHIRHLALDPYRHGRIYAAVQVGGVAISPDNGDTWYDRRNLDLDVHMVEPHPEEHGVVFAGSGGGGLYRSADYGETWQCISEGCGNFVVQFALDPRDASRIYLPTATGHVPNWRTDPAGARGEIFRSDDGGQSWRKLRDGLPELMRSRINTVVVDSRDPDHVYFGAGLSSRTGAQDGGIYHSPDRGETWHKILDLAEPLALCCTRV